MDETYQDLMTRGVDGLLSDEDKLALDRYLERDSQAKALYDNMIQVSRKVGDIPRVPSPKGLKESILNRIQHASPSPKKHNSIVTILVNLAQSLVRPRPALTFALGAVCGIILLSLIWISQDASLINPSQVTGTFVKPADVSNVQWSVEKELSTDGMQGIIRVRREHSLIAVAIDITVASPANMTIDFNPAELGFHGITYSTISADSLAQISGRINVWHRGHMAGTMYFADLSQSASEIDIALVSEDGAYQEVIRVPKAGE